MIGQTRHSDEEQIQEQMNDTVISPPAVPSENVHVRGASTELMQSLTSLASAPLRGAPPPPAPALRWRPAVGQAVMVMDKPPYQDFRNEYGVVTNAHESGLVDISLCSGALLFQVSGESLKAAELTGDEPECDQLASMCSKALQPDSEVRGPLPRSDAKDNFYAPLSMATIEATQSQAKLVKGLLLFFFCLLVKWAARSALIPSWSRNFWKEVGDIGKLESRVEALLRTFGKLAELENSAALAHSTPLFDNGLLDAENAVEDDDLGALNLDLFNQASLVDFAVRDAKDSQAQALSLIARSDTAEVALRRLASYVHEKRTGDRDAATSMLAIKPTK